LLIHNKKTRAYLQDGWAQASDVQKLLPDPMWADTYKRKLVGI